MIIPSGYPLLFYKVLSDISQGKPQTRDGAGEIHPSYKCQHLRIQETDEQVQAGSGALKLLRTPDPVFSAGGRTASQSLRAFSKPAEDHSEGTSAPSAPSSPARWAALLPQG